MEMVSKGEKETSTYMYAHCNDGIFIYYTIMVFHFHASHT